MSKNINNSLINFAPADKFLYLRLIITGALCLLFAVGIGFAVEKFRWQAQAQEMRQNAENTAAVYPHLDASIRQKLEKALMPENLGLSAAQNPFVDRANLSSQKPNVPQPISAGMTAPPVSAGGLQTVIPPNQLPVNNSVPSPNAPDSALAELNNRLRERDRQARSGRDALQPVSTVYDVDDVEPIGVIGKKSASEVLFRSKTTKKVFSAPLGARFNNGILRDAEATGVIFVHDRTKTSEKKFWVKSKPVKETEAEPVLPVNPKN